jgi:hypothetical protein
MIDIFKLEKNRVSTRDDDDDDDDDDKSQWYAETMNTCPLFT